MESAKACLDRIVADSKRAGDIISRIRDLARKTPAQREELGINEVVREVIGLTRSEISGRGAQVRTRLTDGLPPISGDRVQLQQVILNLIMNAIEAMDEVDQGSRELLLSSGNAEADGVLVTVTDTGPGLSQENSARLFEAFYTTKPSGLGMGLSICRSIVETHGGRLWATPNQPRGAMFCMMLPGGEGG
jgi:signal transduction histidine kinase